MCSGHTNVLLRAVLLAALVATLLPPRHWQAHGSGSGEAPHKRPYKNFLRFGRNKMATALGASPALVLVADDGRQLADDGRRLADDPQSSFLRLGRGGVLRNKNFLRFGRGGSTRLRLLEGGEPPRAQPQAPHGEFSHPTGESSPQGPEGERVKRSLVGEDVPHHRGRRALPNLMALMGPTDALSPLDWLPDTDDMEGFHYGDSTPYLEEALAEGDIMDLRDIQKRKFPSNFVRYGREPTDWNFIRFGKRGDGEADDSDSEFPGGRAEEYDNVVRARNNKNFLRFGR